MPRKRTHNEYLVDVNNINENIEVLGTYVNIKTKILHRCKIHNIEWETAPNNILSGRGCNKCGREKVLKATRKTHDQFIKDVFTKNKNIEILGEYINSTTKIKCRCLIDGYEWTPKAGSLISGRGCPKCSGLMKKTTKQYKEEVFKLDNNIEVLDEYINDSTKILHKCKIDNHEWYAKPNWIINGGRCPKCWDSRRKYAKRISNDEFIERLLDVNKNIVPLEQYVTSNDKIKFKCKIDGHEWYTKPSSIINNGHGCPICGKFSSIKNRSINKEEYIRIIKESNPNVILIGEYIDTKHKATHKCLKCDYEWDTSPTIVKSGHGCPCCRRSVGEDKIINYFKYKDIKYNQEKRFKWNGLRRYDFLTNGTIIEFDGSQHFTHSDFLHKSRSLKDTQNTDKLKNKLALDNGYRICRISYSEINNIEKILDVALKCNDEQMYFGKEYYDLDFVDNKYIKEINNEKSCS